jgi:DNA/RNA endonuclease YhcR with UshA esterase domain
MYNPATEVSLKGSVEAVNQIMGRRGWDRTQLSLKAENETIDVRVGPTWFLMKNKMSFAKGDQVEVTGSRVTFRGKDVFIARQIKRAGETFTLRNAEGVPAWWGGHHRHYHRHHEVS